MKDEKQILKNVSEAIVELPYGYKAAGQFFYIYPPSLGVMLLMQRVAEDIGEIGGSIIDLMKSIKSHRRTIAKTLALCSYEDRKQAKKEFLTEERTNLIEEISDRDALHAIMVLSNWTTDFSDFQKYYKLDKEQEKLKKIHDIKDKDKSTFSFNGKSIYGTLIDVVCERYGWTFDYAVWGVSMLNLNMLVADHIATVFLSKDEKKKVPAAINDNNVINMDSMKDKNKRDEILKQIKAEWQI